MHAQPKGDRATITGEVVDLWCFLEGGDRGPAKNGGVQMIYVDTVK